MAVGLHQGKTAAPLSWDQLCSLDLKRVKVTVDRGVRLDYELIPFFAFLEIKLELDLAPLSTYDVYALPLGISRDDCLRLAEAFRVIQKEAASKPANLGLPIVVGKRENPGSSGRIISSLELQDLAINIRDLFLNLDESTGIGVLIGD